MASSSRRVGMRVAGLIATSVVCVGGVLLAAASRRAAVAAPRVATPQTAAPRPAAASDHVNYERDVKPIIEENCLDCHSQDKRKGGLSLATYGDILDGGKDGPIVKPGNAASSMLLHRVLGADGDQMPKDAPPLSSGEIAVVRRWIDDGARPTAASAPAPPPWEAPLALAAPVVPVVAWSGWTDPIDRIVAAYLMEHRRTGAAAVSDASFARRAYLDIWGLVPSPEDARAFVADRSPDKRRALVTRLLADDAKYADHWMSFWNDLLRNDDGVTYYGENGTGRKSITPWLLGALRTNMPYDQFVRRLLSPADSGDPDGFLIGVNWRGETSAAVTPWMQAAQNTAQVFLGINLKCNACHDSFVNRWKLKQAYGLASFFAPDGRLQLFRCEVAQNDYAEPMFLYPELSRAPASASLVDRRAAAAAIFTDPRNGRLPRTLVNRVWQRLLGYGIVANPDDMDLRPWSPVLLDWLASDFAAHGYDVKRLIAAIITSRAYQMPAVARTAEPPSRDYVFDGPEVRRVTAEQLADAIGTITGEWGVSLLFGAKSPVLPASPGAAASDPSAVGAYAREWRMPSTNLSRAMGRPIRDQVMSVRASQPTTPQALELTNGEIVTRQLLQGARRLLGQLPPDVPSLYNKAIAGRTAKPVTFDVDVTSASRLWLLVRDEGSNEPARVAPIWARAEFLTADGRSVPLTSVPHAGVVGVRPGTGPVTINGAPVDVVRVDTASTLEYGLQGLGFVRFRGVMWLENPVSDIGATLDPQTRFYIFDHPPDMDRLLPPVAGAPLAPPGVVTTASAAVDRVFRHALGRAPSAAERQLAESTLSDSSNPGRPSAEGLADLLWAVLMKPEFQLIY